MYTHAASRRMHPLSVFFSLKKALNKNCRKDRRFFFYALEIGAVPQRIEYDLEVSGIGAARDGQIDRHLNRVARGIFHHGQTAGLVAGGGGDGNATDREWRTPLRCGLTLLRIVNRRNEPMHDGRARSIEEVALWHGGEGSAARELFRAGAERQLLVDFVQSL